MTVVIYCDKCLYDIGNVVIVANQYDEMIQILIPYDMQKYIIMSGMYPKQ